MRQDSPCRLCPSGGCSISVPDGHIHRLQASVFSISLTLDTHSFRPISLAGSCLTIAELGRFRLSYHLLRPILLLLPLTTTFALSISGGGGICSDSIRCENGCCSKGNSYPFFTIVHWQVRGSKWT